MKTNFLTAGPVTSSPTISASGAVYIAGGSNVYALPGSAGLAASVSPMFRANPSHNGLTPGGSCPEVPTPAVFSHDATWPDGSAYFAFYLSGTTNTNVFWTYLASSNLVNWEPIFTNSLSSTGIGYYPDDAASGFSNRFYKLVSGSSSSQAIGFANLTLSPGTNLVANPFNQVNNNGFPGNTLMGMLLYWANNFSPPSLPDETEFAKCTVIRSRRMAPVVSC